MARCSYLILTGILFTLFPAGDELDTSPAPIRIPDQLRPFNGLIGEWRGVGQLKRGSRQGAWSEKTSWGWGFVGGKATITATAKNGQRFKTLTLRMEGDVLQLVRESPDEKLILRVVPDGKNVQPQTVRFVSQPDSQGVSYRCTIRRLNQKRTTILFERRTTPEGAFRRTAEIGYTRTGTRLAGTGSDERKCVVTGGRGTMAVTHKGKTWYVCCTGCLQAFQQNPDKVIARYLESTQKPQP